MCLALLDHIIPLIADATGESINAFDDNLHMYYLSWNVAQATIKVKRDDSPVVFLKEGLVMETKDVHTLCAEAENDGSPILGGIIYDVKIHSTDNL